MAGGGRRVRFEKGTAVIEAGSPALAGVDSSEDPIVTGSAYGLFITVEPCEDGRIHFLLGYPGSNKCPVPVCSASLNIYGGGRRIKFFSMKGRATEGERVLVGGDLEVNIDSRYEE